MSDPLVKCPFNPLHVMTQSSLQRHIVRCMKNYPDYVVCPYNALHRYKNTKELSEHMENCSSKKSLFYEYGQVDLNVDQDYHLDNTREFNLKEENWDED